MISISILKTVVKNLYPRYCYNEISVLVIIPMLLPDYYSSDYVSITKQF